MVDIGFDPNHRDGSAAPPNLQEKSVAALVDTGATESCIDSGLAMQLGLPIVNQLLVAGVSGQLQVNMHLAQILIPPLKFTIYGAFAGVHLAGGGQRHLALIGRTFLQNFVMIYNGRTGEVDISS